MEDCLRMSKLLSCILRMTGVEDCYVFLTWPFIFLVHDLWVVVMWFYIRKVYLKHYCVIFVGRLDSGSKF